jgi:hypothetical protein
MKKLKIHDFIFGIYLVILCMGLGLSRVIKRSMVSVFILEILEHPVIPIFGLLGRKFLIYLANPYRKSLQK